MSDWTAGYVADIEYTYGYFGELNPLRARLALLHAGIKPPTVSTACELGFGQGLSVAFHAASAPVHWVGTDFNPTQAGFARELGQASGAAIDLRDDSFEEFAARHDLPDFDYIGLHGIWSWISEHNRGVIVDFLRRKLKVGGVAYVSYNTLPGWSAFAPVRHLMNQHAAILGAEGQGVAGRATSAIDFVERLFGMDTRFGKAHGNIPDALGKLRKHDARYLAHEYFNRNWDPMYFSQTAERLQEAKLDYACSAHFIDHVEPLNLSAEQASLLNEVGDSRLRETVRDFVVNQQFRRDYWVKGARRLEMMERLEALRAVRVMLCTPPDKVPLKVSGAAGEASLSEAVYRPLLDDLAGYGVRSLGEIEQVAAKHKINFSQVQQAVLVLSGTGHLTLVQDEADIAASTPAAQRLNAHLLRMARNCGKVNFLSSPVTGGAVSVGRFGQIFLGALNEGISQPRDMARHAWQLISSQGQKVSKEGKTLGSEEENLAELTHQAEALMAHQLPLLRALRIVEN